VCVSSNYRLYRLDGAGKITTGEWIDAGNDEEAVAKAHALGRDGRYELWNGGRMIAAISGRSA
jgi:hypothetical protein